MENNIPFVCFANIEMKITDFTTTNKQNVFQI